MKTHALLFLLFAALTVSAQEPVPAITADGKRVILKADGTWTLQPPAVKAPPASRLADLLPRSELMARASRMSPEKTKSEFESSAEYRARLDLIGERETAAFDLDVRGTYDADAEEWTFRFGEILLMSERGVPVVDRYNFRMPRSRAAEEKDDLTLVIVGFPLGGNLYGSTMLNFCLREILVVNRKTGEVYFRAKSER